MFGDEITKIQKKICNLCLHFARQDHATKVTKIPKTKRREYGNTINYSLSNIVQDVRNLGVAKLKLSKMIFFSKKYSKNY